MGDKLKTLLKKAEAFKTGVLDSASYNALDELAGYLEASGRTVGVKGLGDKSLSNIGLTEPEGFDAGTFGRNYKAARDERRRYSDQLLDEDTGAYVGGMFAGGALSPFNKLSGAKAVAGAAAEGLIGGIGAGEWEGKNDAEKLEDLALDTGLNTVFQVGQLPGVLKKTAKAAGTAGLATLSKAEAKPDNEKFKKIKGQLP